MPNRRRRSIIRRTQGALRQGYNKSPAGKRQKKVFNSGFNRAGVVSSENMDSKRGENAITHLKLVHGASHLTTDGSGTANASVLIAPQTLPSWAIIGTLFKLFRPTQSYLIVKNLLGKDADGHISIRVTSDAAETIKSTVADEINEGAIDIPLSDIPKDGLKIDLLTAMKNRDDDDANDWQDWHATTPYGSAKQYGQAFLRVHTAPASKDVVSILYKTDITFKSLII